MGLNWGCPTNDKQDKLNLKKKLNQLLYNNTGKRKQDLEIPISGKKNIYIYPNNTKSNKLIKTSKIFFKSNPS